MVIFQCLVVATPFQKHGLRYKRKLGIAEDILATGVQTARLRSCENYALLDDSIG